MRKVKVDNPRYPHCIEIMRRALPTDEFAEEELVETVIYSGPGRGYTDTTTNGNEVDVNKRKASIPMRFDRWGSTDSGRPYPMDGDILTITKGSVVEEWKVRDFEPDNDRTIVYAELNRNIGA